MYELMFFIFELIGTVAFAASGAFIGMKKRMDILGICVLGCVTAVGGGVIRDLILGLTPPKTFENPVYVIVSVITCIVCFLPAVRKPIKEKNFQDSHFVRVMDSIGLGVFTVVGIQTAQLHSDNNSFFLLVFVGVVTGVGGGVIRDIMAGQRPYIFVKHFYASASIIGAVLCALLWNHVDVTFNSCVSAGLVVVLRLLAAKFRWKLPTAK